MKHRILTRIAICLAFLIVPISASKGAAIVNPKFALVKAVTLATISDEIAPGTPSYSLDLRLDTAGLAVTGLQFYFLVTPVVTPGSLLTFDTAPLTALNSPFTANDIFSGPASGAPVNQGGSTTVLFKATAGDYAPFGESSIARFTFNTSLLPAGTYVFTPIGQEFTNANTTVTNFDPPGSFTLTVPEPTSFALIAFGWTVFLACGTRRARSALG